MGKLVALEVEDSMVIDVLKHVVLTGKIIKGLLGMWVVHGSCETTKTKVMAGEKGCPAGPCGREKLAADFGLPIGPTEEQGNGPQLGP